MFTLVKDRGRGKNPLYPTVPVPFSVRPLVPIPGLCSVNKPYVVDQLLYARMSPAVEMFIATNNISCILPKT